MSNHLRRIGTGMCATCNYPDPLGLYEMEGTEARCINCVNDENILEDPKIVVCLEYPCPHAEDIDK